MTTTIDWYGCSTFGVRTAGLHILLDAYIDRAPIAVGSGLRAEDITDCDWILVGHSHFDHLYGAERIIPATGATLIGSYESVRVMERAGVALDQMICVAGGETIELGNDVTLHVYPSLHSCVWSHTGGVGADDVCLGDLGVTWHQQQQRLQELTTYLLTELAPEAIEHLIGSAPGHSERGDGGALVFVLDTPDGSLLFQDTSGHWSGVLHGLAPDVAIIAAAGRANIDGQPIQGTLAEFVALQTELLAPCKVILGHHDNWLPGFSQDTDIEPIRRELHKRCPGVDLIELGYVDATTILGN